MQLCCRASVWCRGRDEVTVQDEVRLRRLRKSRSLVNYTCAILDPFARAPPASCFYSVQNIRGHSISTCCLNFTSTLYTSLADWMATSLSLVCLLRNTCRSPGLDPARPKHSPMLIILYTCDICHEPLDSVVYVSYTISMHSTPDHDLLTLTHMNRENMHWN